jgi:glycosyltransferase involved in cell wall biosynthesis
MIKSMYEITIGIPTFNRPEQLNKLLKELSKQTYRKFFIYISINKSRASNNKKYLQISKKFISKKTLFFFQKKKLHYSKNFDFLLRKCQTDYFMWLADDDRLSYSTIKILLNKIKKNENLVTIMPYWCHITGPRLKINKKPIEFKSNIYFFRIIKLLFIGTDNAVYGMHRTKFIKKYSFEHKKYFFPNKNISWNLSYLFILQILCEGPISLIDKKNAIWINDDYSEIKYGNKTNNEYQKVIVDSFFKEIIKLVIRKMNFYYLVLITLMDLNKYFELFLIILFMPFIIITKFCCYLMVLFTNFFKKKSNTFRQH